MDKKNVLVLGMGEIGKGVYEVIGKNLDMNRWEVWMKDKEPLSQGAPEIFEVMHVCIPYDQKKFISIVNRLQERFNIAIVIIHSTVSPGTTRMCEHAVHVPIRGRHPKIKEAIETYPLFAGIESSGCFAGDLFMAPITYIKKAFGQTVTICIPPETTELAKIIDLSHYAVNLEFSRLTAKILKKFNVKPGVMEAFTKSRNDGLVELEGHSRFNLPRLYPMDENGVIGGHCVLPAVSLLNQAYPDSMLDNVMFNNMEAMRIEAKGTKEDEPEKNTVWQPCNIYPSVKMGENNSIGMFTEIGNDVIIGNDNRIGAHCYIPEGVMIGNDCFLGPRVTFTNDKHPPSGKENWKKTTVGDGAAIGAGVTILPGIIIGARCNVGAGSVVTKDVLCESTVYGNPAIEQVTRKE